MGIKLSPDQAKAFGVEMPKGKKRRPEAPAAEPNDSLFLAACKAHGLPEPIKEYQFHPTRKWRFDWLFCGAGAEVAMEIQGGIYSGGGHVRGKHLEGEYLKICEAQILGYIVLLVTWEQVESGEAFSLVKRALHGE